MAVFAEIRDQLKMTQGELANLLGVDERTIRRWEKDDLNVPSALLTFAELAIKTRTVLELLD